MLKINDIFWSLQGEGLRAGTPAIFVRLSGCTLRCPYCDSRDAWTRGRSMSVTAIVAAVAELKAVYPHSSVVITGGEPMQQDLCELVACFKSKKYFAAVETNGLHFRDLSFDWWTVSPKDVAAFRVHPRLWRKASEVKLLVTPKLTLDVLIAVRRETRAPIVLQPVHGQRQKYRRAFAFYEACQRYGLADVCLGLQLHKIIRVG